MTTIDEQTMQSSPRSVRPFPNQDAHRAGHPGLVRKKRLRGSYDPAGFQGGGKSTCFELVSAPVIAPAPPPITAPAATPTGPPTSPTVAPVAAPAAAAAFHSSRLAPAGRRQHRQCCNHSKCLDRPHGSISPFVVRLRVPE